MVSLFPKRYACPILEGTDIDFITLNGTEDVTVAGSSSTTVTITHDEVDIVSSPEVSVDNTNLSVKVENVTAKSFDVVVSNSATGSQTGTITWSRKGLKISISNLP